MFESIAGGAYLILMRIKAISKLMLPAIGTSLLAIGCSTSEKPALNAAPTSATPAVTATTPAGAPALQGTEAPAPAAKAPARPATAYGGIVVPERRPDALLDAQTMAPAPNMVWVPGAWFWRGRWVWERGHWVHPPFDGAIWVPPDYFERDGRFIYIAGKWK